MHQKEKKTGPQGDAKLSDHGGEQLITQCFSLGDSESLTFFGILRSALCIVLFQDYLDSKKRELAFSSKERGGLRLASQPNFLLL